MSQSHDFLYVLGFNGMGHQWNQCHLKRCYWEQSFSTFMRYFSVLVNLGNVNVFHFQPKCQFINVYGTQKYIIVLKSFRIVVRLTLQLMRPNLPILQKYLAYCYSFRLRRGCFWNTTTRQPPQRICLPGLRPPPQRTLWRFCGCARSRLQWSQTLLHICPTGYWIYRSLQEWSTTWCMLERTSRRRLDLWRSWWWGSIYRYF